jgi:2'-5' RNA ligase
VTTAVVCAAFDAAADDAVEALRQQVEAAGQRARRSHRPHLTLGAARASVESVTAVAAQVAARHAPIPLQMKQLGAFRDSVLWVAPAPCDALRSLQRDVHDSLLAAGWPPAFGAQSEPGRWVAHCTLASRLPHPATRRLLRAPFTPFPATVDALAVIVVGGRGDVAHLPLTSLP